MRDLNPALLWDMDGTILDSKVCHFKSWRDTLNRHGYHLDRKVYDTNFGRNNRTSLMLFLGFEPEPDLIAEILQEKEAYFRQIAPQEASLVRGVKSWLGEAKEAQLSQVVASSAPMENIISILKSFDLLDYFDFLISGADLPAKPNPDIFLHASNKLGRCPKSCWVIEDSLAGVKAAKNAGMLCIAVTTSFSISKLSLADLVVDDFSIPFSTILDHPDLN